MGQLQPLRGPKDGVCFADAFGRIEHVLGTCLAGSFGIARLDRGIEALTPGDDVRDRLVAGLEGQLPGRIVEPLPAQPRVMRPGPRIPARPDQALAQQQAAAAIAARAAS